MTDRKNIPAWTLTKPGEYETRNNRSMEIVGKSTNSGMWIGILGKWFYLISDDGRCQGFPGADIIGPWIECGLPFDLIYDPATDGDDVRKRFVAAFEAGMKVQTALKSMPNNWWYPDNCLWNDTQVYRLKGCTLEWSPPQPEPPLTESRVRAIVREMLEQKAGA